MGLFGSSLGRSGGNRSPTKWMIAEDIATAIDSAEKNHGMEFLRKLYIALTQDGKIEVLDESSKSTRHYLALVKLGDVPEFLEYCNVKEKRNDLFGRVDPAKKAALAQVFDGADDGLVDAIAFAITREFDGQSKEFSALPSI